MWEKGPKINNTITNVLYLKYKRNMVIIIIK